MWAISAGWFDYDNDGHLDLFISNYCKWEVNEDPFCGPNPSTRAYCHPKNYPALPNVLYRNNGDGTFTDVSAPMGIAKYYGKGMGVVFADYDHDGFIDVFVANDNAPNLLFRNLGGKGFEEVGMEAGVAIPEGAGYISGMGADFKDIDNDGWEDIWHTAIEGETFPLFKSRPARRDFIELTVRSGLSHATRNMSGWSNGIADLDNDGWKDLFTVRSNVQDNIALMSSRKYEEPVTIFRNLANGKFQDMAGRAGKDIDAEAAHRGVAYGDLDNDGRIDLVVSVLNGPARLFRNVSSSGNNWIAFHLTGVKSNRMGIGARIVITTPEGKRQYNHATTSTGYACSSDHRVHFGLGSAADVKEAEITWPSGIQQRLENLKANQYVKVKEPEVARPK
jgi:enediyne biosynthesis protein E4